MKKRYLVAGAVVLWMAAYAAAVKAETWVMPNQGGGEITLTSQTCQADNGKWDTLKHAYSWTNQIYFEGCWTVVDGNVHIVWVHSDGTRNRRVYPITSFNKKGGNNGNKY